jgi:SAM-dependent methyltransferase
MRALAPSRSGRARERTLPTRTVLRAPARAPAANDALLRWYPEARFGGFTDIDGTVAFYTRVRMMLPRNAVVADVGCGRGARAVDPVPFRRELRTLRGHAEHVIGIDVDERASGNPLVDEFRLIPQDGGFPLRDGECDLVVSDFVLEHVADPERFFAECRRVLRPGGRIALRTTNARSYVGLVSRLVPNRHHGRVVETAQKDDRGRAQDVFPTVYRCNTAGRLRRTLRQAGFDAVVYGYESEPHYFCFSRALYALAVLHQRLAPSAFRLSLFAFGQA